MVMGSNSVGVFPGPTDVREERERRERCARLNSKALLTSSSLSWGRRGAYEEGPLRRRVSGRSERHLVCFHSGFRGLGRAEADMSPFRA